MSGRILPDEDLLTPEHLLHGEPRAGIWLNGRRLERVTPEDLARAIVTVARDPEFQAGLAGQTLLPLLVLGHMRRPSLPLYLILTLIGNRIGVCGYRAYRDLHDIAERSRDAGQAARDLLPAPGSGGTEDDGGDRADGDHHRLGESPAAAAVPDPG